MKLDKRDLILYAVTDRTWIGESLLINQIIDAIKGGATFLQLREKNLDEQSFINEAKEIKKITDKYKVPFVINDNIEVALKADADGVHIGQKDMPVSKARQLLGPKKILGVSAQTVEQAKLAEQDGADYLGVGAVFNTSTKADASTVSYKDLKDICTAVRVPVVAIGGINEDNLKRLQYSGIAGVAVVSAIFAKQNIKCATKKLKNLVGEYIDKF